MIDIAILILRVGLGVIFIAHGSQKVFGAFGGPGLSGFANMLGSIGFAPAMFWAYVGAFTELLGGLGVLFGFGTKLWAALLLILITVATVKVHLGKGFFLQAGGFEYNLLISCVCITLILLGGGKYSIIKQI